MEYNPVCGVDGMTYGNKCSLDAEHMGLKHHGECMISDTQSFDSQKAKTNQTLDLQNNPVSIVLRSATPECGQTNECYLPYSVSISEHSSVTWTNDDMSVHTATSGNPSDGPNGFFDSGLILPGGTYTNQFNEEGTYDYFCIAHPWMTGNVVVLE